MHVFSVIRHPLTDVILYGERRGASAVIRRVLVGINARRAIETPISIEPEPSFEDISRQVLDFLGGKVIELSTIPVDRGAITPFQSAILTAAALIPYGATFSYAELALSAGFPKAIRAAASVMRNNPFPLLIPCHRVIRSDGTTGAYAGDRCGEDAALKKALLQLEQCSLKKRP